MISKADYERVGGMSEDLAVAFNDIDFCMKVREAGLLVVYNPAAELYHYESKSRGIENTAEKVERFNSEIETFSARWRKQLLAGDPYYNVNLSLNRSDFGLRE
jgi:GT2 family glycosyltransferase